MRRSIYFRVALLSVAGLFLLTLPGQPQTQPRRGERFVPRLEAVAETRLLMEGIAQPNFRALEGQLKQKPESLEAWTFARGQALLIAETGNLLLLRPPRNEGRDTWQMRATELRDSATALARTLAQRDLESSRKALSGVANACNRCHQSFRVQVRVVPFGNPGER
jgi:hypothetical protein